ncbi:unnamed protein product [Victoria cruziana]
MSSIAPIATKGFAARIEALGADWLDAPVSGGEVGAKAGTLTIMVGGQQPALVFAAKAGADPAKVREALMGGFASSRILEVHGERMLKRTFNPGFRIALHQKDLNLALQSAKAVNAALPGTANAAQLMQACAAQGWDQLDHSALVRALELLGNQELGTSA